MDIDLENIRLLLVDDEEGFRQTIAKRMSKRGLASEHAGNGEECLALMAQKPIDVVVLDVKMPGMNGLETLDIIKKKYPQTEVILLTGHSATSDGVEGIKTGAFDYLTKPIELEHLIGKIKQAYEKILRNEEIKREAEFKAKMEQQMIATERLASLGTLSTGVAHEINNPLAIIKESAGFMRMVLGKEELSGMPRKQDLEKALEKIENAVERSRRITHQLLGFVKKQESVLAETNLKILVDETIGLVEKDARHKEIDIVRNMDSSSGIIWSDPYQIRQVLLNLFTNAIHAVDSKGSITITLKDIGNCVSLTIADTGKGIPKENMNKIFEPFFSTKPANEGTGLGLYVTRGIITRLGGGISVESEVGRGTRFCVTLPKVVETECVIDDKNMCSDILEKIKGETP